jgi:hypothetical protein
MERCKRMVLKFFQDRHRTVHKSKKIDIYSFMYRHVKDQNLIKVYLMMKKVAQC